MLFYNNTKATVIEQAGKEAKAIAYVIAASLASDAADYRVLYENAEKGVDGVDQAIYQRFLSEFHALRVNTGASIFSLRRSFRNQKSFIYSTGNPRTVRISRPLAVRMNWVLRSRLCSKPESLKPPD
ncbi:MAG TPA: hypothetical protein PKD55_17890 [Bellilinea sp.]|nr:hypothetical protein [Bellilinea sp.]